MQKLLRHCRSYANFKFKAHFLTSLASVCKDLANEKWFRELIYCWSWRRAWNIALSSFFGPFWSFYLCHYCTDGPPMHANFLYFRRQRQCWRKQHIKVQYCGTSFLNLSLLWNQNWVLFQKIVHVFHLNFATEGLRGRSQNITNLCIKYWQS